MTEQGLLRLRELEEENQRLLRELKEENARLLRNLEEKNARLRGLEDEDQRLKELEEGNRRLRKLEAENQLLKQLEEENQRLRELGDENVILKRLFPKMNEATLLDIESYFTNEVLEDLLTSRNGLRIGGERKRVTILFSDLRRSTEISELLDAADFIRMLNHYFENMIEIINAWQGNILDFVGDSIVVVFGAPRPNEFSARDAVACAVAMQRRMQAVNEWNLRHGYPEISMGIGIHTGEAILGNIGSETRRKYDMIGRNVNLASRIQGYTNGGQILVSTDTLTEAGEQILENKAGSLVVNPKGIQDDIYLHDIVGFGEKFLPGVR